MNNYITGEVQYQKKPTLWQQSYLSKEQEQELYNFLSIGCGTRCRERSKQLNLAIQRKKQIVKCRRQIIKIMRKIGLDKGFAGKIARMLEKSGLSLDEQKQIFKQIKKLLLDFKRGVHNRLDLRGIKLSRLPLSLRRFIIALIVLKAEIANLFRLYLDGLAKIREHNNRIKLSIDDRNLKLDDFAKNLDNHKDCSSGVSLSKGKYNGMLDIFFQKEKDEKKHSMYTETSKNSRNKETNKQQNKKKYYKQQQKFNDKETQYNERHFYERFQQKNTI